MGQLATFINTDDAVRPPTGPAEQGSGGTRSCFHPCQQDRVAGSPDDADRRFGGLAAGGPWQPEPGQRVAPESTGGSPLSQEQLKAARARHLQMCEQEAERKAPCQRAKCVSKHQAVQFAVSEFEAWLYAQKDKLVEAADPETSAAQARLAVWPGRAASR